MENNKKSVFETLNAINVNDMVEKKRQKKALSHTLVGVQLGKS